jgi:hypothetical protein
MKWIVMITNLHNVEKYSRCAFKAFLEDMWQFILRNMLRWIEVVDMNSHEVWPSLVRPPRHNSNGWFKPQQFALLRYITILPMYKTRKCLLWLVILSGKCFDMVPRMDTREYVYEGDWTACSKYNHSRLNRQFHENKSHHFANGSELHMNLLFIISKFIWSSDPLSNLLQP